MKNKNVTLYVSGGIAVYKATVLARTFIKNGANVKVVMTKTAQKFVTPLTFKALTHEEVYTDLFSNTSPVPHIELADWTDIAVVVPATADIIAKMANGIADDFASTTLLATVTPKYIVPAMNDKMWQAKATQRNIAQLKKDGGLILEPVTGMLAEGYVGKGRMPEPDEIYAWISENEISPKKDLLGKNVLISAGKTVEKIDPVRYIANRSSGKMGYALAKRAKARGANVTLVSGPTNLTPPAEVKVIDITSAKELEDEMLKYYPKQDIVIMSAAVADYHVAEVYSQKVKKTSNTWNLKLTKNPDILKHLGELKENQMLVGFAAETNELIEHATEKLHKKNVDLLVANDVSRKDIGFGTDENEALFLTQDGTIERTEKVKKTHLADMILDKVLELGGR